MQLQAKVAMARERGHQEMSTARDQKTSHQHIACEKSLSVNAFAVVGLAVILWAKTHTGMADHNLPSGYGASFGPIQILEIVD